MIAAAYQRLYFGLALSVDAVDSGRRSVDTWFTAQNPFSTSFSSILVDK
ncbi:MAG: hypothetical protein F6K42_23240 [Leptolyngbya sp. SIO1D8]|nr:hypothetical protein [Leptolyngbya sp. SIO1D8]